jgi:hypothetical protein
MQASRESQSALEAAAAAGLAADPFNPGMPTPKEQYPLSRIVGNFVTHTHNGFHDLLRRLRSGVCWLSSNC